MTYDSDISQRAAQIGTEIEQNTRERIHEPIVSLLYEEFQQEGVASELARLVALLPEELYPLVLHSLSTHVTREKSAWTTEFSGELGVHTQDTAYIGAVCELLWTAALIADDVEDEDQQRAGTETVWVRYGKADAFRAWNTILDALQVDMNARYSAIMAGDIMRQDVNIGLQSLREHRQLSFTSTMAEIERNYYRRAMFHANLPFEVLFASQEQLAIRDLAIQAVQLINNAGQILNDLKDLTPGPLAGRAHFGDIRNGVVTIPLKLLYDSLGQAEQDLLTSFMGHELAEEDARALTALLEETQTPTRVVRLALEQYQSALALLEGILPNERLTLLRAWIEYKTRQAMQLLTSPNQDR